MRFDPTIAAVRFGSGLSPLFAPPVNADALLGELEGAPQFDIIAYSQITPTMKQYQAATRASREARGTQDEAAKAAAFRSVRQAGNVVYNDSLRATFARSVGAQFGFSARLQDFWADHFTVKARNVPQRHLITGYVEEAIRPHIASSFGAMLRAVATHPAMLVYLEQFQSVGPDSQFGQRRGRGLNENFAREFLELHTLGVGGPYTQTDVRELAELLTGLTYQPQRGFFYDKRFAEPGAETVLGITYDAADGIDNILDAIDALARHPQTAAHICEKIARYFIGQDADATMVAAMTDVFITTDGWLPAVYAEMLDHPAAWDRTLRQIKSPLRFMTSAMRALGLTGAQVVKTNGRQTRELLIRPLVVMGQPWQKPLGPDGWPDNGADWVNPQGMAGRISWAMTAPREFLQTRPPDPRSFVVTALGDLATQDVIFAASAAEVRDEGIGIILSAPAFQRS
uniref:DUF1800 domain-containing protein n=1 Tax=Yoonia sp. TaxID=2212373 RepID=UPI004048A612